MGGDNIKKSVGKLLVLLDGIECIWEGNLRREINVGRVEVSLFVGYVANDAISSRLVWA